MAKHEESHGIKIEAGQILNPDNFPTPNELVCIQVPKVFDQVALRDCETSYVELLTSGAPLPTVAFEAAENFDIKEIKVISRADALTKPGFKKLRLAVVVGYDVVFSVNGVTRPSIPTTATFNLVVNEIYCPSCTTQIGVIRYPESTYTKDKDGTFIKVEAIAEAFNDRITVTGDGCSYTFTLALDIGAFFVVKCECEVQLLIPAYGYCPVPPEQQNVATQTCSTFTDRSRTQFPTAFFPDQKWNPIDKAKKEDWDD